MNTLQFYPTTAATSSPRCRETEAIGFASASVPFLRSILLRLARQAMIAIAVRKPCRLIALPPHRPSSVSRYSRDFFGFSEEEPRRFDNVTKRGGVSAGNIPQRCGAGTAVSFEVAGLITWLKRTYPRSTTHHVEAQTGIPAASVENWLHRRSQPSVQHFSILISVYGPSFLAACFIQPPVWVHDAVRVQRRKEIDAQISRLESERAAYGETA